MNWIPREEFLKLEKSEQDRYLENQIKQLSKEIEAVKNLVLLLTQAETKDEFLLYVEGIRATTKETIAEVLENVFKDHPELKTKAFRLGVIKPKTDT